MDLELLQVYKVYRLEGVDNSNLRSEYIVPILTFSPASFSGTSEPAIVYQVERSRKKMALFVVFTTLGGPV